MPRAGALDAASDARGQAWEAHGAATDAEPARIAAEGAAIGGHRNAERGAGRAWRRERRDDRGDRRTSRGHRHAEPPRSWHGAPRSADRAGRRSKFVGRSPLPSRRSSVRARRSVFVARKPAESRRRAARGAARRRGETRSAGAARGDRRGLRRARHDLGREAGGSGVIDVWREALVTARACQRKVGAPGSVACPPRRALRYDSLHPRPVLLDRLRDGGSRDGLDGCQPGSRSKVSKTRSGRAGPTVRRRLEDGRPSAGVVGAEGHVLSGLELGPLHVELHADASQRVATQNDPVLRMVRSHDLSRSRSGGSSKPATRRIAAAAFDGSPGCAPLYSRWNRATAPTVAAYTGLSLAIVVDDPAKSVRKPPGSMIVTLTPRGPTSFARTSENPSTPHFAAAYAPRPTGPESPADGRELEDVPGSLSPHDGDRRLRHVHDAEEVRFDLRAEVLHARVLDRRQVAVPGVVREHVEPPERHPRPSGPPRSRPARQSRRGRRRAPDLPYRSTSSASCVGSACRRDETMAGRENCLGERAPQPARATR